MIVHLDSEKGDNETFFTAISSLIAVLVNEKAPKHLYVVRVKKWFDHKWLNYSGIGRIRLDFGLWRDTAIKSMWRDKLTFPPFHPKQIGTQYYWRRAIDGTYGADKKEPRWVHKRRLRSRSSNLQYRVADFTDSGLFVWFTSNTEKNMHGSVMVYIVDNGQVSGWYASFKKENAWSVDKTKGIDKKSVESWFPI